MRLTFPKLSIVLNVFWHKSDNDESMKEAVETTYLLNLASYVVSVTDVNIQAGSVFARTSFEYKRRVTS